MVARDVPVSCTGSVGGGRTFASWFAPGNAGGKAGPTGASDGEAASASSSSSAASSSGRSEGEGAAKEAPASGVAAAATAADAGGGEASDSGGGGGGQESAEALEALLKEKEQEAVKLRAQVEQLTDSYKRTLAEMENVRTRAAREMDSTKKFAVQKFAQNLFDVADNLGRALEAVPAAALQEGGAMSAEQLSNALRGLVGGLGGTEKSLLQALSGAGVVQYNPVGEVFDPNLHSALFQVTDATKEAGTIAVVTKRGYKMHERVVRPAEVGVVKAAA